MAAEGGEQWLTKIVKEICAKNKFLKVGMAQVILLTRRLEEAEARRERARTRGNRAAATSIVLSVDVLYGTRCRFIDYVRSQHEDLATLHQHFEDLTGRTTTWAEVATGVLDAEPSESETSESETSNSEMDGSEELSVESDSDA